VAGQSITCPVDCYQDERELSDLLERVREIGPRRILEIGSLYGGTLWRWMHEFPGALVVSLDLVAVDVPEHPYERILEARAYWESWAAETGCELAFYVAPSASPTAIEKVSQHAPFDFIFVDGGHRYHQVEADFRNYWPMLRPGGIMAFHDCACWEGHPSIDVGAWWRDLERTGVYAQELISYIPDWWGIGVIYK
jgi:predicted O-methyltransferase YrrM